MRLDVILILTIAPQSNYTNGNYNHFSLGLEYGVDMPNVQELRMQIGGQFYCCI